jgi:hypothetical protein
MMGNVINHVPDRMYVLKLNDGKKVALSVGLNTLGVFRCGWLSIFNPLRPLWQWDISALRRGPDASEAIRELLETVKNRLLPCDRIAEVEDACRTLLDDNERLRIQAEFLAEVADGVRSILDAPPDPNSEPNAHRPARHGN